MLRGFIHVVDEVTLLVETSAQKGTKVASVTNELRSQTPQNHTARHSRCSVSPPLPEPQGQRSFWSEAGSCRELCTETEHNNTYPRTVNQRAAVYSWLLLCNGGHWVSGGGRPTGENDPLGAGEGPLVRFASFVPGWVVLRKSLNSMGVQLFLSVTKTTARTFHTVCPLSSACGSH